MFNLVKKNENSIIFRNQEPIYVYIEIHRVTWFAIVERVITVIPQVIHLPNTFAES